MRRSNALLLIATGLLALGALAGPAHAWYPKAAQAETATATWCANCYIAYDGLEANKGTFDVNEFNAIRYYDASGSFGCATSTARIGYYSAFGYPKVYFGGTTLMPLPRPETETAAGLAYRAVIEDQLADPSYFKLTINSVDFSDPTGSIDLDVTVMEDVPDIAGMEVRVVITEGNVATSRDTYQDITRSSTADVALTVDSNGQVQNVFESFPVDPAWDPAELTAIAFIQDDDTQEILASASSAANPPFSFRYYALGDKFEYGPITIPDGYYFDWVRVYNTGDIADIFTFTTTIEQGPGDWFALICGESICYGPTWQTQIQPGAYVDLHVQVQANSSGAGTIKLNMTSASHPDPNGRSIYYSYVTDDIDVLVVDDDGVNEFEDYYTDALDHYSVPHGMLKTLHTAPTAAILQNFDTVIWANGWQFPTLTAGDRAALGGFLDGGGNLFLSGQRIGYELLFQGGDAYQWFQDYLHAFHFTDDMDDTTLEGVAGDQISDGIPLSIAGGDGADNQDAPSEILPADGSASSIWLYNPSQAGGIKIDTGTYKAVYLAFGFEAIDNARDRRLVMHRILNWFQGVAGVDDTPRFHEALSLYPNPVRGQATARFTLPQGETASLKLYGIDGRLVRTLAQGHLAAGQHVIDWDGADASGTALPAGLYYARLEGERTRLTQKLVVLD